MLYKFIFFWCLLFYKDYKGNWKMWKNCIECGWYYYFVILIFEKCWDSNYWCVISRYVCNCIELWGIWVYCLGYWVFGLSGMVNLDWCDLFFSKIFRFYI